MKKPRFTYFQVRTALSLGYISPLNSKEMNSYFELQKPFETLKAEEEDSCQYDYVDYIAEDCKTFTEYTKKLSQEKREYNFEPAIAPVENIEKIRKNSTSKIKCLLLAAKEIICTGFLLDDDTNKVLDMTKFRVSVTDAMIFLSSHAKEVILHKDKDGNKEKLTIRGNDNDEYFTAIF